MNIIKKNFERLSFIIILFITNFSFLISRDYPKKYIENAIEVFKQHQGKNIVEIGSMRYTLNHSIDIINCIRCMDGHSTIFWANTGVEVWSVDIDPKATKVTTDACRDFKNVHVINCDAIEFLKKFDHQIDLLFLDAWDAKPGTDYKEKHLLAYETAKKKLHDKSLILIDDTDDNDLKYPGKGFLLIPQAIKDGYKIIFSGRQTLLSK